MLTLGIETSCDDTGVALYEDGHLLCNEVASQYDVHEPFGGVVPELAARAHLENLPLVLDRALEKADRDLSQVDLVAATAGPGLLIALLVGLAEAKGLALGLGKPLVAVNHLRAHLYAAQMAHPDLEPPYLGLLVSGGHTSLVLVGDEDFQVLGGTRDDAAGECFDKVARVAGLGSVGGPAIQRSARGGDPQAFRFPRSQVKGAPLDFSFSGLKTAASRKFEEGSMELPDFCASFQEAVVDNLARRVEKALDQVEVTAVSAAGGVAASVLLGERLRELAGARGLPYMAPPISLCTDNAGMIAGLGTAEFLRRGPDSPDVQATPSLGFRLPREARLRPRG